MPTSLQGQQEICRYLERGINQQSLINIINRAGQKKTKQQKKKTGRKRKRQRTHGCLEIK